LAASRGTLEEEIHEDLRKKGDYMKGDFISKLPSLQQADKTLLFETVVSRIRGNGHTHLNTHNMDLFLRHNILELFREFDTDFRGDVQSISELPTQKPTLILQTRKFNKGVPEIRWYVAHHDEQGKWKTTSESWTSAEHAIASSLCPEHQFSIIALMRDAEAGKKATV
jgi:hypothetical protein